MKILGIITEYNPFHNGHMHHLQRAKELSGCDYTICILSSNFMQRGEPSIISKWARAETALMAGVDIVIELPVLFSMSSAEYFAYGSVKILDSLNSVETLCFGSESGSVEELKLVAELLTNENDEFKSNLKAALQDGNSFAKARETAVLNTLSSDVNQDSIKLSNNILGIEYLKALNRLKSSIRPITINRISNQYNSTELSGAISSATSIRKNMEDPNVKNTMPISSFEILQREFNEGRGPIYPETFEDLILAILRRMSPEEISKINYVSEGLDKRIYKAAQNSCNFYELMKNLSTKRYPNTRLQRILFSALLGITSMDLSMAVKAGGPPYAKVLGFNERGKDILGYISKNSHIPVVTNLNKLHNSCSPIIQRMIEIERIASDIYVLGYKNPCFKKAGQEFTSKIVATNTTFITNTID